MLRIPERPLDAQLFAKELIDECMATTEERQSIYEKASQYYYTGSGDVKAAIHNKVGTFIDRLAGYLYQPNNVRFNTVFDSAEPMDVLERGRTMSEMLTADYRAGDADLNMSLAVKWALNCGCYFLKHLTDGIGFKVVPVHPANMGVLSETVVSLDEQEAFCHVSYPTITRLRSDLIAAGNPHVEAIIAKISETRATEDDQQPTYFHSMVVGGMNPVGSNEPVPQAAGIVQVFPIPTPWRPQRKIAQTVRHCELWIKDQKKDGTYTTMQLIYPDILIEGGDKHNNLFIKDSQEHGFVKVEVESTPGYFWGRSTIADVQMLQDVLNKRLRDLKVEWDRNAAAPYSFAGFTSLTEEAYYKLISEGGFISDPNPQAKAQKLTEPPTPGYLEELEFIWKMFDEAGGFTPIMTGQGEPSVRAGVHAQTLVRTSASALIDQATRIERQVAQSGYLCARLMQFNDPNFYETESKKRFLLEQLPDRFQVEVDSHSASPAFAEDSRQIAIALARAQAIDAEDLIEMLHPPNAELLLAKLKQRKAAAAKAQQEAAAHGQLPAPQGKAGGRAPQRAG